MYCQVLLQKCYKLPCDGLGKEHLVQKFPLVTIGQQQSKDALSCGCLKVIR